jgi:hypothetical protein
MQTFFAITWLLSKNLKKSNGISIPKVGKPLGNVRTHFFTLVKVCLNLETFLNSLCLSLGCKPKVGSWQCWLITHVIIIWKMTSQKTKWQLPKFVERILLTKASIESYILKLQCLSVCLSVWAVLGRFFQSLPVPCGVFWGVGEGKARWGTGLGGQHGRGKGGTGGEGPGGGELDRCIMHRVHTSNYNMSQ